MTSPTDLPGIPELPAAVDLPRLQDVARERGWAMVAVGEQTLRGRWDDAVEIDVTIPTSEGVVVLVRGRRLSTVSPTRAAAVEELVLQWHRQRVWPSLYVATDEEGQLVLHAHVGIDATEGLTTVQLSHALRVGVGTIQQAFAELTRLLADGPQDPDAPDRVDDPVDRDDPGNDGPDGGPPSDAPQDR